MDDRSEALRATAADVRRIFGRMPDARLAAILAAGATVGELEEAAAWAAGESDVMGPLARPVVGPVATIYEIITTVEEQFDEQDGF